MDPFTTVAATRHDELLADVARRRLLAENPDRVVPAPWRRWPARLATALRARFLGRALRAGRANTAEDAVQAAGSRDDYTTAR